MNRVAHYAIVALAIVIVPVLDQLTLDVLGVQANDRVLVPIETLFAASVQAEHLRFRVDPVEVVLPLCKQVRLCLNRGEHPASFVELIILNYSSVVFDHDGFFLISIFSLSRCFLLKSAHRSQDAPALETSALLVESVSSLLALLR